MQKSQNPGPNKLGYALVGSPKFPELHFNELICEQVTVIVTAMRDSNFGARATQFLGRMFCKLRYIVEGCFCKYFDVRNLWV